MASSESLVEFRNQRGKRLRGMLHRPRRALEPMHVPAVVFFHGFTGDRMEAHWVFVKCARTLAKAGIASLRFDFYGSGESEGEFSEVRLESELADAKDAVEFCRWQRGVDPERLGLLGLSLGGTVAACIASRVKASALVLWAALAHPDRLRALAERATRPLPDGHGTREYGGIEVSSGFLENLDQVDPLKSIARFKRPTLIIHPEKDEYLPLSHPEDFFQAAGATAKEKVIIPGADHTFASVPWEHDVIGRTVDWFRRYL